MIVCPRCGDGSACGRMVSQPDCPLGRGTRADARALARDRAELHELAPERPLDLTSLAAERYVRGESNPAPGERGAPTVGGTDGR